MIFHKGELFCGPGGLTLGAYLAGEVVSSNGEVFKVKHRWANDIDKSTCETYRYNIKKYDPELDEKSVIEQDVKELDIESLPPIDAFAFGFPCNDFSNVGETHGLNGKYGPLYTYGVKILKHHQPKWFIAENVGGLESANEGQAFVQIMGDLQKAGYKITPHFYKFEEYGVPQARRRIIIVGIRNDLDFTYRVPKRTHADPKTWKTSKQALEEPPIPFDALNNEFTAHQGKVIEMLSHIPPGENAWYSKIPKEMQLNVKSARLSSIYKRLHPDLPAYTVTGSGGGGTHMYHYRELRALTNRERARLQTFPDDYFFIGKKENVRKQIGMAVPPEGAKVVVEAILKTFAGIEYEWEEPKWDEKLIQIIGQGEETTLKEGKLTSKVKKEVKHI